MKAASWSMAGVCVAAAACAPAGDPAPAPADTQVQADALHGGGKRGRHSGSVTQTNLVSDEEGKAAVTNTGLVNAWGLAFNPAGPAWVSSNEEGTSLVFDSTGKTLLTVTIPPPKGGEPPSAPTGQVFNGDASAFMGDTFIFVTEDGTVSGWQRPFGTEAMLRADRSGDEAIYKGVAIGRTFGRARLFAADFHNGRVDVYDDQYHPMPARGFVDRGLPRGYAPFNVATFGPLVLVTYAQQDEDREDDVKGAGHGFVDLFDLEGHFLERLISRGVLDSPWGVALAPSADDPLGFDLLVGNFGDGRINVYDISFRGFGVRARLEGPLLDASTGAPLAIDGLWAIAFGPDAGGFSASDLFFTAGPEDESHGLFGKLSFVTQP